MRLFNGHWQLILISLLVFLLWNTPATFPLRVLIVFLHEIAHGLAAVLTGGSIESISVNMEEGGVTYTRGGSRFVILSAGYVGSLLLGIALFLIALKTHADRAVMALLGALALLIALIYTDGLFPKGFAAATGLIMLLTARFLNRSVNDLVLRLIGLTSMIYVPYDIFSDTLARSALQSDARMLAEEFGGTTMFWGGLWLVLSLAAILLSLRYGLGKDSNIYFRKSEPE